MLVSSRKLRSMANNCSSLQVLLCLVCTMDSAECGHWFMWAAAYFQMGNYSVMVGNYSVMVGNYSVMVGNSMQST